MILLLTTSSLPESVSLRRHIYSSMVYPNTTLYDEVNTFALIKHSNNYLFTKKSYCVIILVIKRTTVIG